MLCTAFATGCSNASNKDGPVLSTLPVLDVVATSEIALPEIAEKIAYSPNSVAPWLGHIIIQSSDGTLYRTTAQGDAAVTIQGDKSSDIFGLYREKEPGVFLSITEQGSIAAYVEDGPDGQFKPLAVSMNSSPELSAFCTDGDPVQGEAYMVSSNGDIIPFSIGNLDANLIEMKLSSPTQQHKSCPNTILESNSEFATSIHPAEPQSLLSAGSELYRLNIGPGLSVQGLDTASAIASTHLAMGSTYNDGVIAVGDANSPRLVLLAKPYVERQIASTTQ